MDDIAMMREALALAQAAADDVMVRPCGFASVPRLAPLWKALDDFGFADADWTPYWKNPVAVSPVSIFARSASDAASDATKPARTSLFVAASTAFGSLHCHS